ncbi:DUF664 domain-containing protein [Streptomyces sp. NPDC050803]|uniref:mycothiol transferase n=1 Tax=unclassified Streptomyces TaxID=2593676 RepID=UPI003426A2C4
MPTLQDVLTNYRMTLLMKCEGLDPEQLARRSVPPSTMSLLGLVRHLAETERNWISAGDPLPRLYGERDADFDGAVAEQAVVDAAYADLAREQAALDTALAGRPDRGERKRGPYCTGPSSDCSRAHVLHLLRPPSGHVRPFQVNCAGTPNPPTEHEVVPGQAPYSGDRPRRRPLMRARIALAPAALAATVLGCAGEAAADAAPHVHVSNNAPVVSLVNNVHINDPLEDVLEHTLNFGDGYTWA